MKKVSNLLTLFTVECRIKHFYLKHKIKKYVSHIATDWYDLFIDRKAELSALDVLKNKDFLQKPIYLSDELRLFEYVEGDSMNHIDYKKYYKEISQTFHKLYDTKKLFEYNYEPLKYIYEMNSLLSSTLDPL